VEIHFESESSSLLFFFVSKKERIESHVLILDKKSVFT
jgi:hypothetical protein